MTAIQNLRRAVAAGRRRQRRHAVVAVATALVLGLLALIAPAAHAAAPPLSSPFPLLVDPPDGIRALPTGHGGDLVVDRVHGHVFLSRGMPFNSVVVTDLDGQVVKVLTGLQKPQGMALGPDGQTMFVALADGDAVAAIDLTTLTERHRTSTGPGTCPQQLASAGGRLWVAYGCSGHTGAVAALDTALDVQPLPDHPDSRYLSAFSLTLAGASPSGRVLAVTWGWWNGSLVDVFDVSGPTPVVIASRSRPEGLVSPADIAVTPDGETVFVAGTKTGGQLGRYGALAFASSNLSDRGFYETATYISSVAVSPDGRHIATSANGSEEPDFLSFPIGTYSPTHVRTYEGGNLGAVGWAPDGATVYVPDSLPDGTSALRMIHGLGVDPGEVEVSAPAAPVAQGATTTVSGRLRIPDGTSNAGLPVKVTRSGPDGTRALPVVSTGPDGGFTITDTPSSPGGFTYRFTWPGDRVHPPATASGSVRVAGTVAVTPLPAPLAGARIDRDLGLSHFGMLVVDEMHRRLLVSGKESGTVVVST